MKSEQLCELVIDALEEVKARDIVKLDVRELTTVTDWYRR
jgi:ribosome-associated protein